MAWDKIWLVMRREYLVNFRRPGFLFTAFGVPLLSIGAMFLIIQLTASRETNLDAFQRVGYVDEAHFVSADAPNPQGYVAVGAQGGAGALDAAHAQLVAGDLDAYFVIAPHYVLTGQVDLYTRKSAPQALQEDVKSFMAAQVIARAPTDLPVPAVRLGSPNLTVRDLDTGEELGEAGIMGRVLLPFLFVLIYFMATSTTAQYLMSGVVEEKENRLMEILATSLRPQELLWGKLGGLGALALTQVALWGLAGVLIASFNADAGSFVAGAKFTAGDLALILALFIINFFLFSASMLAIGVSVTAEAESRQIAGAFTFMAVLPIMLLVVFFNNPNGVVPVILSFFPFTGAVALTLRMGLTTLPLWQIVLSVAIQAASVVIVMWLAGQIFRLGMLMYGKPLTPRALWRALREGRQTLTTAAAGSDGRYGQ